MKKLLTLAAAFAALAAASAPALAQEKETPPAGSAPRGFAMPKVETYSLKNGMQVTLVPFGRVPKAFVLTTVQAGNLNDGDTPWISDLTADMMGEGSDGKTASDIALEAALMGGDVNISVGLDQTSVSMDVLSERVDEATSPASCSGRISRKRSLRAFSKICCGTSRSRRPNQARWRRMRS